jgi:hypothetical protein
LSRQVALAEAEARMGLGVTPGYGPRVPGTPVEASGVGAVRVPLGD